MALEMATVGGGSFWCTEAVFQQLRGVRSVRAGYSGGTIVAPDYTAVSEGNTGHAEVVQVCFDPEVISYRTLLEIFFATHDPTTLNRQGNESGTQYRSVIFTHSLEQEKIALKLMRRIAALCPLPAVTQLLAAPVFYPAEEEHHDYFKRNSHQAYCTLVVAPKVRIAREFFSKNERANKAR